MASLSRKLTASGSLVITSVVMLKLLLLRWQVFRWLKTDKVVCVVCFLTLLCRFLIVLPM
jgi:hypothetical protein